MHATLSHFVRTVAVLAALPLLPGVAVSQTTNPLPNTNGQPGFWLPAVDHGDHLVGCAGGFNPTRFIPIHGSLIPKGPFRGCVLVWEKGNQGECMLSGTSLSGSDVDMRWAIFDPRVNPPVVHNFAWRVRIVDAPTPPCQAGAPPGYQGAFCSGHCWLPDGRLLVAGGDYWVFAQAACSFAPGNSGYAGSRFLAVFDPDQVDITQVHQLTNGPGPGKPWTSLSNPPTPVTPLSLQVARWYPSVTLMAPANLSQANPWVYISVAGGVEAMEFGPPKPRVGDPAFNTHELLLWNLTSGAITRDPRQGTVVAGPAGIGLFRGPATPSAQTVGHTPNFDLSFFYYPRVHFVSARQPSSPDGRLWMAGMVRQAADADVINLPESWNSGDTMAMPLGDTILEESMVVMFPPVSPAYRDWQIVMGGRKNNSMGTGSGIISRDCYIMNTRASPGFTWFGPTLPMHHERLSGNAVIGPDASIIVIGGSDATSANVYEPEMFFNGAWFRLSNQWSPRTYHSWALLLPDGRILSAGGDSCSDNAEYEIFEPHYLQGAPVRPAFVGSPPTVIRYGQQHAFGFSTPFGQSIDRVVLLRPGSLTHGQDTGQRYEPLAMSMVVDATTPTLTITAPANATLVPPGYCMLFLISSTGVPSIAHWVQLLPL